MTGSRCAPAQQSSTTVVMSLAAIAAALIAMFGEPDAATGVTVCAGLVGLVPWALVAGGVRLSTALFAAMTFLPAAVIVLVERNPGGMFPIMLAIVSITRTASHRLVSVAAVIVASSMMVALALLENTWHETGAVYFIGGAGVAWLAGTMVRRQEELVAELQDAHRRETEHAAATERTRIAREVHDVVAHSLTVVMLHVTGARRAITTDPTRAAEALGRAEVVGRESLDSIRQMVGLLRADDSAGEQDAPLPGLDDIPALVVQFREAGLEVSADLQLSGVVADPATALTAFRVVQEALSNVLQHSPGAPCQLRVARDGGGTVLRIVAENPTVEAADRTSRAGLGLRGMRERVRAAGGSVEAGSTPDRRWRIDAALPLRRLATTV